MLGEVERQLKNPRRALEVLQQALEIDPTSSQAHYYLGLALLDLNQPAEAIKELERVVQAGEKRADVYLSLGAAYLDSNRLDEGLETLSQATHLDPARPDIRIQLARGYRLKGQLDKAEAQLKMATPQGPASVASPFVQERQVEYERYLELGLLKQQQGQLAAAADAFRKVLEMDPDHGPTNRNLAEVYLRQGQYGRALDYATRAEKLGSPLPDDKRKLLQDGLQKQKQDKKTGNGRAEVNELRWFAPLLVSFALLPASPSGQTAKPKPARPATFVDVTAKARITFVHKSGASPEKYMVETFGSGVAWIDYDNDGFQDLYFVNGAPGAANVLYRNNKDGTFKDVTAQARVDGSGAGKGAYKTGVAVGDYDNNGYLDLFVTSFGPDILYKNNGDGTFTDVTAAAGVAGGASEWSTSTGFLDYDRDGDLDLYVANYLDFRLNDNPFCGLRKDGYRMYCHPTMFDGMADRLFRNNGNGTFTDVSRAAGIANPAGKGLGVVFCDFDRDGDPDIYVANDMVRNFLYKNNGNGTFTDVAYAAGVGFDGNGKPQAGMGVDCGDVDGQRLSRHLRHQLLGGVEHAVQQPRRRGCSRTRRRRPGWAPASSRSASGPRCSTSTTTATSTFTSPTATSSTTSSSFSPT